MERLKRIAWTYAIPITGTFGIRARQKQPPAARPEPHEGIRLSDLSADHPVPKPVPVAIAERLFSGNFQTRVPADLHRRLTLEAAEAGVSLNRLVSYKLTTQVVTVRMVAQPRRSRIPETA